MSSPDERSVRVSTLELFFDLVFVFTITQLTGYFAKGEDASAFFQVAVMLLLIWWIYDGYAWLTNAITTEHLRFRLLLLGGMGGFLVMALAVPRAYDGDGRVFGLAYMAVVLLHAVMYMRGTSASEVAAILRLVPFNLLGAVLLIVGGALGGNWQSVLWALAAVLLWVSPHLVTTEGFVVSVSHFVERHGLLVIVALGESIVVLGAGAASLPLNTRLVSVALLSLSLTAALWWVYFSDETAVEQALHDTSPERRAGRVLHGFGYWHYGILLGIVAIAAGLKEAIAHPFDSSSGWIAAGLGAGVTLYLLSDVGYRQTFGLALNRTRLLAAAGAPATIPLGTEVGAAAQVVALAALLAAALVVEALPATRR